MALKPAMVSLANQVDQDVMGLYSSVANWVGTPGNILSSYAGFLRGTTRMNNASVPKDARFCMLSPDDEAGLADSQTKFLNDKLVGEAYRDGGVGRIAQVDTYMSQNVPVHVTGSRTNGTVAGAGQNVTYTQVLANGVAVKDFGGQLLNVGGLGAGGVVAKGDVFTIAGVFAVNHVTKQPLPYLRQFTVMAAAVADGNGAAQLQISPAIIAPAAFPIPSARCPALRPIVTTKYQREVVSASTIKLFTSSTPMWRAVWNPNVSTWGGRSRSLSIVFGT